MGEKPAIKQVCMIQIMFPSDDNTAINVKKKIDEALSELEDKRIELHLTSMPSNKLPVL
jgi:hypothetical protein